MTEADLVAEINIAGQLLSAVGRRISNPTAKRADVRETLVVAKNIITLIESNLDMLEGKNARND